MIDKTESKTFNFDIRRSIVLSKYMKHWGMPEFRQVITKENVRVELYTFPGQEDEDVTRFSTIGLSSQPIEDNSGECDCAVELLMLLPKCVVYEQEAQIKSYLFDVAAYLINTLGRTPDVGTTIPESPLAPDNWPKALLFDEPRGEPEELSCFQVGRQHINLLWLIPIYGSEYKIIRERGLDEFDKIEQQRDVSLVDIRREPVICYGSNI